MTSTERLKYYVVLGLSPGASREDVKRSYLKLVKVWHPDRFAYDAKMFAEANVRMVQITDAYDRLKDYNPTASEREAHRESSPKTGPSETAGTTSAPPRPEETQSVEIPTWWYNRVHKRFDPTYISIGGSWDCVLFIRRLTWDDMPLERKFPGFPFFRIRPGPPATIGHYTLKMQLDGTQVISYLDIHPSFLLIIGMPLGIHELSVTPASTWLRGFLTSYDRGTGEGGTAQTTLNFNRPGACQITLHVERSRFTFSNPAYIYE